MHPGFFLWHFFPDSGARPWPVPSFGSSSCDEACLVQRSAVQCRGFCFVCWRFWFRFWVLGLGVGLGTAGTGSTGAGTPAVSSDTALVATEKHHPGFYPQWHGSRPRKTPPTTRQASWSIPMSFVPSFGDGKGYHRLPSLAFWPPFGGKSWISRKVRYAM